MSDTTTPTVKPRVHHSAKARFQQSADNISKHHKIVDSSEFQRGIDFALLAYQEYLTMNCRDANTAMTAMVKQSGAHEFIQIFKELADPQPTMPTLAPTKDHLPEIIPVGQLRRQ